MRQKGQNVISNFSYILLNLFLWTFLPPYATLDRNCQIQDERKDYREIPSIMGQRQELLHPKLFDRKREKRRRKKVCGFKNSLGGGYGRRPLLSIQRQQQQQQQHWAMASKTFCKWSFLHSFVWVRGIFIRSQFSGAKLESLAVLSVSPIRLLHLQYMYVTNACVLNSDWVCRLKDQVRMNCGSGYIAI